MIRHGARRFRRIPVTQEAALELRRGAPAPVLIRSITCEGVGIAAASEASVPEVGVHVELRFYVATQSISLPGTIVWRGHVAGSRGGIDAGIHFELEHAQRASARLYADWIVDRIAHAVRQEHALGAVLVRTARLPLAELQRAIDEQRRSHRTLADILVADSLVTRNELEHALHQRLTPAQVSLPEELLRWRDQIG